MATKRRIKSRCGKRSACLSAMDGFRVVARWRVEPDPTGTGFNVTDDFAGTCTSCDTFEAAVNVAREGIGRHLDEGLEERPAGRRRQR